MMYQAICKCSTFIIMNSTKLEWFCVFFCQKKWLLDIVQVNFMYFTHEEAETQILHKYTVV